MPTRNLSHFIDAWRPEASPYESPRMGRPKTRKGPPGGRSRREHASHLTEQLEEIAQNTETLEVEDVLLLTFSSFPEIDLALETLENYGSSRSPIELLSVKTISEEGKTFEVATVRVPLGRLSVFLKRVEQYAEIQGDSTSVSANWGDTVSSVQKATIRELWLDDESILPAYGSARWWEAWFDSREVIELNNLPRGIRGGRDAMVLQDRVLRLLLASREDLEASLSSLPGLVALRSPSEPVGTIAEAPRWERLEWMNSIAQRLEVPESSVYVTVIDTGIYDQHPLLMPILDPTDIHVVELGWPNRPEHTHGTEMAGLAAYGQFNSYLIDDSPVRLTHRLESVKLIRRSGETTHLPRLYGSVTTKAIDLVESREFLRSRVHLLPITAPTPSVLGPDDIPYTLSYNGEPTSWSASIDALAFGKSIDITLDNEASDLEIVYLGEASSASRLFVIPAGNIDNEHLQNESYLDLCDANRIQNPGQSWNALTVGAYTELDTIQESGESLGVEWRGTIAPRGGLSPTSRTSVLFDNRVWPPKPDLVAEGGNIALAARGDEITRDRPASLSVLTTTFESAGMGPSFTTTFDTSSASAIVAHAAAVLLSRYPTLLPEAVRGLLVHTAEWSDAMLTGCQSDFPNPSEARILRRRYGMGAISLERALASAANDLVLVGQGILQPFKDSESDTSDGAVYAECHFHDLPWPRETLLELGDVRVELRVTLSYFIEPNPSPRGWRGKYSYQSHGLRFGLMLPTESKTDFKRRINKKLRDGSDASYVGSTQGWTFGLNPGPGSILTDIWRGSAADLASMGHLAVYPVSGWWKPENTAIVS